MEVQDERQDIPQRGDEPVAPVRPPAKFDPVLNSPEFRRFVPPGFQGDRFDLVRQYPAAASAMQQYVQGKAAEEARDREYMQTLQQSSAVEEHNKAIVAARKFIAQRRFGRDVQSAVQSGLPLEQALAHSFANNPEMLSEHVAQAVSAARLVKPPTGDFVPKTMTVDGQKMIQESPQRWSQVKAQASSDVKPAQRISALNARAKILLEQLKNEVLDVRLNPASKGKYDKIRDELDQVNEKLKTIDASNEPSSVKVKRKSDGKEFTYKGDATDVPTDKYEVVR